MWCRSLRAVTSVRKTLPLPIDQVLSEGGIARTPHRRRGVHGRSRAGRGADGRRATLGRSIAAGLGVPSLGVHHMEGRLAGADAGWSVLSE